MLKKYMNKKEIAKHLVSYSPFEDISNREYWDMLKGAGEEELCKLR